MRTSAAEAFEDVDCPDERLFTLDEACAVFFRGLITPYTLRAMRDRGELAVAKWGKWDMVTAAAVRQAIRFKEGRDTWQGNESLRGSISTPGSDAGSSGTETTSSAQAAASVTAAELIAGSLGTSTGNTGKSAGKRSRKTS